MGLNWVFTEVPWQMWAIVAGAIVYDCYRRSKRRQEAMIELLWEINRKLEPPR